MHAHAIEDEFYSGQFQEMRKILFFKSVRIRFGKKSLSTTKKSEKQTLEISISVKK